MKTDPNPSSEQRALARWENEGGHPAPRSMKHTLKDEIILTNQSKTIKVLYSSTYKLIGLGFKEGQLLEKHTTPTPAVLIVQSGAVDFSMNGQTYNLKSGDYFEIPANVDHEVSASEDSLLYLIK